MTPAKLYRSWRRGMAIIELLGEGEGLSVSDITEKR